MLLERGGGCWISETSMEWRCTAANCLEGNSASVGRALGEKKRDRAVGLEAGVRYAGCYVFFPMLQKRITGGAGTGGLGGGWSEVGGGGYGRRLLVFFLFFFSPPSLTGDRSRQGGLDRGLPRESEMRPTPTPRVWRQTQAG